MMTKVERYMALQHSIASHENTIKHSYDDWAIDRAHVMLEIETDQLESLENQLTIEEKELLKCPLY